jgi:hypothetical protein
MDGASARTSNRSGPGGPGGLGGFLGGLSSQGQGLNLQNGTFQI